MSAVRELRRPEHAPPQRQVRSGTGEGVVAVERQLADPGAGPHPVAVYTGTGGRPNRARPVAPAATPVPADLVRDAVKLSAFVRIASEPVNRECQPLTEVSRY
ncbi:hypothetical protein GCM10010201_02220 [Pilimelia columellifera subsp. columellifera]|uniref:Uncharacterized protein n=1 Tax=Pilimelia columellifera subsp. columellifera TaxID=706583 RepID=A0ABN3MZ07_9ACTN